MLSLTPKTLLLSTLCVVTTFPVVAIAQVEQSSTVDGASTLPELLDAERAFQIAKAAASKGEYQTAIVALERVLLINPALANIKLELGLLYKKVGAETRAQYYIQEALEDDSMPPEVRERAISELNDLQRSPVVNRGQFYGSLGLSATYDSNALSVSDTQRINDPRVESPFSPTNEKFIGDDLSVGVNTAAGYRYRFGSNSNVIWNTWISLDIERYNEFTSEDAVGVFARSGVTFPVKSSSAEEISTTFTPFFQLSRTDIDDSDDEAAIAFGLDLRNTGPDQLAKVTLKYEIEGDEDEISANTIISFKVSDRSINSFGMKVSSRDHSIVASQSYVSTEFSYTFSRQMGSGSLGRPVILSLGTSAKFSNYSEANLTISPDGRNDEQVVLFSTIEYPLLKNTFINVALRYIDNRSSVINFQYENTELTTGITWRF